MRGCSVFIIILALIALTPAQEPVTQPKSGASSSAGSVSADSTLAALEAKIRIEWEALKNKDRKAYGQLLADDYQGVEIDGRGERNKIQSVNELVNENIYNYTLERFKLIPLGPEAACVIYEFTTQFPRKAQGRFSRVYISDRPSGSERDRGCSVPLPQSDCSSAQIGKLTSRSATGSQRCRGGYALSNASSCPHGDSLPQRSVNGKGTSLLDGYMEDSATDRVYRLMVAQRVRHKVRVPGDDNKVIEHLPNSRPGFLTTNWRR